MDIIGSFAGRDCGGRIFGQSGRGHCLAVLAQLRAVLGLAEPLVLNLGVLVITFGLSIKITMASIFGVAVALVIYRYI